VSLLISEPIFFRESLLPTIFTKSFIELLVGLAMFREGRSVLVRIRAIDGWGQLPSDLLGLEIIPYRGSGDPLLDAAVESNLLATANER